MYQRFCKDKFDLDVDESGKDIARACFFHMIKMLFIMKLSI